MTHQNQPPPEGRQSAADLTASDSVDQSHPKGPSRAELYLELQRLRDENALMVCFLKVLMAFDPDHPKLAEHVRIIQSTKSLQKFKPEDKP